MCSNRVSAPCEVLSLLAIYSAWKRNQLYINLVDTNVTILKYQWRRLLHCTRPPPSSQALPDARCQVGARAPQSGRPIRLPRDLRLDKVLLQDESIRIFQF
jgi:hypothetical protein